MKHLQAFINKVYRHPKSKLENIKRFGGNLQYNEMMKAKEEMYQASYHLDPVMSFPDGLPIFFLTGCNYFYQTLFCITSLVKNTHQQFRFYLIDDGTLNIELAKKQLPNAVIVAKSEIEQNLDIYLPEDKYPVIRQKRLIYPHLKKLTDIHTISTPKHKLVLDSDMLFWREPDEIIRWLQNPERNLFMTDVMQSYGYSESLMQQLCGYSIPPLLNVGVAGLRSETINWDEIERWITTLEATEGATYYLEQALTAMLAAGGENQILPAANYVVYPRKTEALQPSGVLHHYVDLSKKEYYTHCWRKFTN